MSGFLTGRTSLTTVQTADIAANAIDGTLTKDALVGDYSDVTITAADLIMYGDATDSNNTKRDTVQGILDLGGILVQQVASVTTSFSTHTTVMPADDTIPQNDEGGEILTRAITPTNSSNILEIYMFWTGGMSTTSGAMGIALFQDSTSGAIASTTNHYKNDGIFQVQLLHRMAAGTTSSTTFKMRVGMHNAGTTGTNGSYLARRHGGVLGTHLTIKEFAV
jgi:hypothetical protein